MTAKSGRFEGWTRYRKATNAHHEWIKHAQDDMETLKNWKLSWCSLLSSLPCTASVSNQQVVPL